MSYTITSAEEVVFSGSFARFVTFLEKAVSLEGSEESLNTATVAKLTTLLLCAAEPRDPAENTMEPTHRTDLHHVELITVLHSHCSQTEVETAQLCVQLFV